MTVSSTFVATAYGPPWGGIEGTGITATGVKLPAGVTTRPGPYVVAVDPSVIPEGTLLKISPNPFGDPNIVFSAQDTGGAIKGNRIDFFDPLGRAHQDSWGRRPVSVSIVGKGAKGTLTGSTAGGGVLGGATVAGATSAPSGGGGTSDWLKLLLDAVFVAFGAAMTVRGVKRTLARPG